VVLAKLWLLGRNREFRRKFQALVQESENTRLPIGHEEEVVLIFQFLPMLLVAEWRKMTKIVISFCWLSFMLTFLGRQPEGEEFQF